jgi:hypothetical protein
MGPRIDNIQVQGKVVHSPTTLGAQQNAHTNRGKQLASILSLFLEIVDRADLFTVERNVCSQFYYSLFHISKFKLELFPNNYFASKF